MPGGLSRATASADTMVVSMQQGGGSKDTWVLSDGPVQEFSLLSLSLQPVELSRAGNDLPSRAADNLFWLGRYAERAEGAVRLLRGILLRLTDETGLAGVPELPHLLRALNYHTQASPANTDGIDQLVLSALFDERNSLSLAATLQSLRRVIGTVRDRISTDMWKVISRLDLGTPNGNGELLPATPGAQLPFSNRTWSEIVDWLDDAVSTLAAFGGLTMESMTRGQAWRFLDMGRLIERSLHTMRLVRNTLLKASANEGPLLEALLEIADCSMTYRRRYLGSLHTAAVLDLLLADDTNPQSLAFQLTALSDTISQLPPPSAQGIVATVETNQDNGHLPERSPEQRLILTALTALQLADIEQLAHPNADGVRDQLEILLSSIDCELPLLSDAITSHYLSHLLPSRHLGSLAPDF
jgi:uncharacterized alpha-E superfamily protein